MQTILICLLWLLRDVTLNILEKSINKDTMVTGKLCEIVYIEKGGRDEIGCLMRFADTVMWNVLSVTVENTVIKTAGFFMYQIIHKLQDWLNR